MAQFAALLEERQESVNAVLTSFGHEAPKMSTREAYHIVGALEKEAVLWPMYSAKRGLASPWILAALAAVTVLPAAFPGMDTAPTLISAYGVGSVGYYAQVRARGDEPLGPIIPQGPYVEG